MPCRGQARGVVEQWAVARQSQLQGRQRPGQHCRTSEEPEESVEENTDSLGPAPEAQDFLGRTGKSAFSQASQGMWMRPEVWKELLQASSG